MTSDDLVERLRTLAVVRRTRDVSIFGEDNVRPVEGFFEWKVADEIERLRIQVNALQGDLAESERIADDFGKVTPQQYQKEIERLRNQLAAVQTGKLRLEWRDGAPPKPWSEEWFIAETTFRDRVVLRSLPEEWTYDFKTADDTYIKADKIKRWMQFPDSEYIAPAAPIEMLAALPDDKRAREDGWQPIETAPRDGTAIMLGFWYQGRFAQYQAFYGRHGWMENSRSYHCKQFQKWFELWHPLPAPPTPSREPRPPRETGER